MFKTRALAILGVVTLGTCTIQAQSPPQPNQLGRPASTQWSQFPMSPMPTPQVQGTPNAPANQPSQLIPANATPGTASQMNPTYPQNSMVPPAAPIGTRVITTPSVPANTPPISRVQGNEPAPPPMKGDVLVPSAPIADRNAVFRILNDRDFDQKMIEEINSDLAKKWEKGGKKADQVPKYFNMDDLPKYTESKSVIITGSNSRATDITPRNVLMSPGYVVHRRLYFEDKNSERYGWSLGAAQPIISAGHFFKDVLLWPSHAASNLFDRYDTSAGKLLPGSAVPYMLYPPDVTLFGASMGAAAIIGVAILFP